jgi:hypothetical protein
MSRFHSYLLSAQNIIEGYKAGTPFAYHLKSFFHVEKNMGQETEKSFLPFVILISEVPICSIKGVKLKMLL